MWITLLKFRIFYFIFGKILADGLELFFCWKYAQKTMFTRLYVPCKVYNGLNFIYLSALIGWLNQSKKKTD